jgi:putative transposase
MHSDHCAGGPVDPVFSKEGVSISVRSLPGMGEPPRLEAKPSGGLRFCREIVEYRRSSHAVFRPRFHFVFTTKYRKPVLKGDMAKEIRNLTKEIGRTHDIEIVNGQTRPDHIHILLDVPPKMSPSKVMQAIKGKTSHHMLQDHRRLRREFWGRHLLGEGIFCGDDRNGDGRSG